MESRTLLAALVLTCLAVAGSAPGCAEPRDVTSATVQVRSARLEEPRHEIEVCQDTSDVHFFVAPREPAAGTPLRILAVSDQPLAGALVIARAGEQGEAAQSEVRHGGPPYFWSAEVPTPRAGGYTAKLVQRACGADPNVARPTVSVPVASPASASVSAPQPGRGPLWPTRGAWTHQLENVYSAWIELLFDAPDGAMPSWSALHEVLRDRTRNLLFDYLGTGEDSADAPVIRPDCADLPYFLRAYFAFKLGLPFGVSECDRGSAAAPPRCKGKTVTNEDPPAPATHDPKATAAKRFGTFLGITVADRAQSGSARVPFDDERSDYYPVPLTWASLRPGTVYADPYGHVFVVAKRLPQGATHGGALLVVDGQPDGTVARKRFWRGNFLYARAPALGGPGWKRFRPLAKNGGRLVRWGDDAIRSSPDYGDLSLEPGALGPEAFFDAMDDLLSPRPLDPRRAMLENLVALEEQIRTRVDSVDSGRTWLATARTPAVMPGLEELFEATGTWEDFSTPSRDLRLLVAMDFVAGFPADVARRPARYAMPNGASPASVETELGALLARELDARTIRYPRTDGSLFTLSLAEVVARKTVLEVAYNPNDCVEVRWGAPAGSDEERTCRQRAPAAQQERMEALRGWFHDRRRPPRR